MKDKDILKRERSLVSCELFLKKFLYLSHVLHMISKSIDLIVIFSIIVKRGKIFINKKNKK